MMMMDLLQEMAARRKEMMTPEEPELPEAKKTPGFIAPYNTNPAPQRQSNMPTLLALAAAASRNSGPTAATGYTGVDSSFLSGGENPWGIDPNGMNLVSSHGVTLDEDAMATLLAARRAGYNPFPYIGGGYRDPAVSDAMHAQWVAGNRDLPAAAGGHSMHNFGLAFDAGSLPQRIAEYLFGLGWYNGASWGDPPHYSYGRNG